MISLILAVGQVMALQQTRPHQQSSALARVPLAVALWRVLVIQDWFTSVSSVLPAWVQRVLLAKKPPHVLGQIILLLCISVHVGLCTWYVITLWVKATDSIHKKIIYLKKRRIAQFHGLITIWMQILIDFTDFSAFLLTGLAGLLWREILSHLLTVLKY